MSKGQSATACYLRVERAQSFFAFLAVLCWPCDISLLFSAW